MVTTVTMADSIGSSSAHLPISLAKVGMYVTGSGGVPWSQAEQDRFVHSGHVKINQDPNSDPLVGSVLDIEDQAWSIQGAIVALEHRHANGRGLAVYLSAGILTEFANAATAAKLPTVNIWLANWTLNQSQAAALVDHQAGPFPIKAVQWASPSSNPGTVLPGTSLTLQQANADLSVADASWFPAPASAPPPPPPKVEQGLLLLPNLLVKPASSTDGSIWHV